MQVTIVVPDSTPEQRRLPMERLGARVLVRGPVDMLMRMHMRMHMRMQTHTCSHAHVTCTCTCARADARHQPAPRPAAHRAWLRG